MWSRYTASNDRSRRAMTVLAGAGLPLRSAVRVAEGSAAARWSRTMGITAAFLGGLTAAGGQLPDSRA